MNKNAEQHVAKARDYVEHGEDFYRKAAEEIVAAQDADPTLTLREIDRANQWYEGKAGHIVRWLTSGSYTEQALPRSEPQGAVAKRHTRAVLRDAEPEELRELMQALPAERRAAVVRAAVPPPQATPRESVRPSFIDLLVRTNSALIELEALVASWQNTAAVPAEFSRESFSDVVQKALRIQDKFDELVAAIDNADEDEFQKIVRNFRVTSDVV